MSERPRDFVAAIQVSLDGYMQGANGEVDWVDSWSDALDLIPGAGAAVLGGGMYPGYEQLWGSIAADPGSGKAMLGREVTEGEIKYARWTQASPHYVLSTSLSKVNWPHARLVHDVKGLRVLKEQAGGAVYVVGGPTLVSRLLNGGLIDELRLIVHPIVLGDGKGPFAGLSRQVLELRGSETGRSGRVVTTYRVTGSFTR
ncbi:MAG: dihydrofolate reductase family protein [Acidimicrobiaceae bacterium]|nr:dihydrofolate reductase family protein [Acidimicrobiaceae bacterium]